MRTYSDVRCRPFRITKSTEICGLSQRWAQITTIKSLKSLQNTCQNEYSVRSRMTSVEGVQHVLKLRRILENISVFNTVKKSEDVIAQRLRCGRRSKLKWNTFESNFTFYRWNWHFKANSTVHPWNQTKRRRNKVDLLQISLGTLRKARKISLEITQTFVISYILIGYAKTWLLEDV